MADFGIARFREEDLYTAVETQDQERLANFRYSAPEQRERDGKVDERADIFALGLMLNELFTRQVPQGVGFQSISTASADHAYLDDIVDQMIQQNPGRRPTTIESIKRELIARGNDFVSLQRLNTLKAEVVPEGEVDDPLIADPIRLSGADYDNGMLQLQLSRSPNPAWIYRFQNLGNYESILGKGPDRFDFRGGTRAYIPAGDSDAHILVNYFKTYVEKTNQAYVNDVEATRQKMMEEERRALQEKVAQEEKRQRILKSIRI